jgi:hypothetical protein
MEVKMAIASNKRQGSDGVKVTKVEGGREEEKELIVRQEVISSRWKTWNHDTFSCDRSKKYSV